LLGDPKKGAPFEEKKFFQTDCGKPPKKGAPLKKGAPFPLTQKVSFDPDVEASKN